MGTRELIFCSDCYALRPNGATCLCAAGSPTPSDELSVRAGLAPRSFSGAVELPPARRVRVRGTQLTQRARARLRSSGVSLVSALVGAGVALVIALVALIISA